MRVRSRLFPDVACIHVHAADKFGNARIAGPAVNDIAAAAATRKLIITAEEIVSNTDIRWNNKGVSSRSRTLTRWSSSRTVRFRVTCRARITGRGAGGKVFRHDERGRRGDGGVHQGMDSRDKDIYEVVKKLGGCRFMINNKRLAKAAKRTTRTTRQFQVRAVTPNTPPNVFD